MASAQVATIGNGVDRWTEIWHRCSTIHQLNYTNSSNQM